MKKIVLVVALALVFAGATQAQTYLSWPGGFPSPNKIFKVPVYCAGEGDYIPTIPGTANDSSAVYVLPVFHELWMLTKPFSATSGESTAVVAYVYGRFTTDVGATGRTANWKTIDSSYIATPDTAAGDFKKINMPPGVDQLKIFWDGLSDNDASPGPSLRAWLLFKY